MKIRPFYHILFIIFWVCLWLNSAAQNPIVQTMYTADPAPLVVGDSVYLYVGRDESNAPRNSYLMREYRLFVSGDMVNWEDRGAALRTSQIAWSHGDADAAQCVLRKGKYYYYISTINKQVPGVGIGVLVADKAEGPFRDPLGHALITNDMTKYAPHGWDDLDPTIFVDDDQRAYLFWGNGACYWVELNDDMCSLKGRIQALDIKDSGMIVGRYTEAPWVFKRNGWYYLVYAAGFPESIHYSMSKSIRGPWKAAGIVMPYEMTSNTNHPGIIDFKGRSFFFYHNDGLAGGHSYDRSVSIEEFGYLPDGKIPTLHMTKDGVQKPVCFLNPYTKHAATTMAFSKGLLSDESKEKGIIMKNIYHEDFIKVRQVDFGKKTNQTFTAEVSSRYTGGNILVRVDSLNGPLVGTIKVPYTGEWENWVSITTSIKKTNGVHDLYFVFDGEKKPYELFHFASWMFSGK